MNTSVGQVTLIDMISSLERKEVLINKDYQRGSGIWPNSAKSYFIDTILEGYPFPKIYLYQVFGKTNERPVKEIVDGQQRVTTIIDFYKNKFSLSSTSKRFSGMRFNDLPDDIKSVFISYQIETSTIYAASRAELLEMFRRMNAYTAPLSTAEKRHAMYQGKYKWFIVELSDEYSEIFENYKILTSKQLARMGDAEFISELGVVLERGIVSKSSSDIDKMYKYYDDDFIKESEFKEKICEFFDFLTVELSDLSDTYLMKSYVVHSLFCAYISVRYGLLNNQWLENELGFSPDENIKFNLESIITGLGALAASHEVQDENGLYKQYVAACLSTTTKQQQRKIRTKEIAKILLS
ncbi:DUF262 domain-containing protein [Brenneria sp. 4F2]|nr:DUF262 domain-containing protein [Brenneria bubanii]